MTKADRDDVALEALAECDAVRDTDREGVTRETLADNDSDAAAPPLRERDALTDTDARRDAEVVTDCEDRDRDIDSDGEVPPIDTDAEPEREAAAERDADSAPPLDGEVEREAAPPALNDCDGEAERDAAPPRLGDRDGEAERDAVLLGDNDGLNEGSAQRPASATASKHRLGSDAALL